MLITEFCNARMREEMEMNDTVISERNAYLEPEGLQELKLEDLNSITGGRALQRKKNGITGNALTDMKNALSSCGRMSGRISSTNT